MKKFISLVLALVMALSLSTVAWGATGGVPCSDSCNDDTHVAAIGTTHYTSMADAVTGADAGETIVLLKDIPLGSACMTVSGNKKIALDLNGKTLSAAVSVIKVLGPDAELTIKDSSAAGTGKVVPSAGAPDNAAALFINDGAKVTLMSGTLESAGFYTVALGYGSTADTFEMSGGTVKNNCAHSNLSEGFAIITDGNSGGSVTMTGGKVIAARYGVLIKKGSFTMGGGTIEATDNFAISTNGDLDGDVSVSAGTITSTKDAAIYHPSTGALNITGGTITGATGVYVKSGSVSITGGTISGTGTAANYTFNGGGCNPTGDALVVDSCNYPGGAPAVSVTGGTFTSAYAAPVASYVGNGVTAVEDEFIEGGTFSGAVAMDDDLLAADSALVKDTNGNWVAAPAVTKGDKFDLYQADDGMATALKLKTPDVPGLSFEEVSAKEYTDGSGNVAYIVANNGQYFVKTTSPYTSSYAVTYAGKTDVLYYVNVGGAGAGFYAYEEEVTAFTNFGVKCGQLNVLPVPTALEVYFQDGDGKVYKAAATVGGVAENNYLLNGQIVTAIGAGQDVIKHAFVFNDFDYNTALKQNVPVMAICTKCLEQTSSIYLRTKVPATYTVENTTGEGSVAYTVALADSAVVTPVAPSVPSTDKVTSADTFDAGIALYVGMSVMAAAGSAVVLKKRED